MKGIPTVTARGLQSQFDANRRTAPELDNVESPLNEVTQLLLDWKKGDHAALDHLTPLVY